MKQSIRFVLIFLIACVGSLYLHELGHAVFGWIQGIPIFPSPAKEYVLVPSVTWRQEALIAVGGVGTTVAIVLVAIVWTLLSRARTSSAVLAGVLVEPGFYTLRAALAGRGHDGTEWQEAQYALGLNPTGHAIDLLLAVLFFLGCAVLAYRDEISLRWRAMGRTCALALLGLVTLIAIQIGDNAIFDRHFPKTRIADVPAEVMKSAR
jgi:hypothetical protein